MKTTWMVGGKCSHPDRGEIDIRSLVTASDKRTAKKYANKSIDHAIKSLIRDTTLDGKCKRVGNAELLYSL